MWMIFLPLLLTPMLVYLVESDNPLSASKLLGSFDVHWTRTHLVHMEIDRISMLAIQATINLNSAIQVFNKTINKRYNYSPYLSTRFATKGLHHFFLVTVDFQSRRCCLFSLSYWNSFEIQPASVVRLTVSFVAIRISWLEPCAATWLIENTRSWSDYDFQPVNRIKFQLIS